MTQSRSTHLTLCLDDRQVKLVYRSVKPVLLVIVLIGCLWIASGFSSALAQTGGGFVRPEPLVFEVGLGQVETLQIVMENAVNVYGVDFKASFDANALEIYDSDPTRPGVQMLPGTFPQPDFVVINAADNQAGSLQYVLTQVNPTLPANGNGVLLSIQIMGKQLGETPFTITSVETADRAGFILQTTFQDGIIRVVTARSPTATPLISQNPPAATTPVVPTQTAVDNLGVDDSDTSQEDGTSQSLPLLESATPYPQESHYNQGNLVTNLVVFGFLAANFMLLLASVIFYKKRSMKKNEDPPGKLEK